MEDLDILGIENIRAVLCGDIRTRQRDHAEIEWRVPGTDSEASRTLAGYPAVFGQPTTLYQSKRYLIQEVIAPGFFDDVLGDDCHLNYVHESASAMARNGISGLGGMELTVDAHGLHVFARLPLDDLDVQRLAPKMDRKVVDQMSFAFSVAEDELLVTEDETGREVHLYTLKKCARLFDVCVCPLGAYSQTEAMLRNVFSSQVVGRSLIEGRPTAEGREADEAEGPKAVEGRSSEGSQKTVLLAEGTAAVLMYRERKLNDE